MRFTFIAAKKAEHTVTILCRCLCVTRSGFYAWQARPESLHASDDRRLKVLVHTSFAESRRNYGSPRVHDDLIDWQERVSRKRVVRLMQEEGLKARVRKRYKHTTMSAGVVARIVTGPHDANRQDPHRPMRYDTGRPRAVIRFKISQPRTASLPCPAGFRARRPSPMMDL